MVFASYDFLATVLVLISYFTEEVEKLKFHFFGGVVDLKDWKYKENKKWF